MKTYSTRWRNTEGPCKRGSRSRDVESTDIEEVKISCQWQGSEVGGKRTMQRAAEVYRKTGRNVPRSGGGRHGESQEGEGGVPKTQR